MSRVTVEKLGSKVVNGRLRSKGGKIKTEFKIFLRSRSPVLTIVNKLCVMQASSCDAQDCHLIRTKTMVMLLFLRRCSPVDIITG